MILLKTWLVISILNAVVFTILGNYAAASGYFCVVIALIPRIITKKV